MYYLGDGRILAAMTGGEAAGRTLRRDGGRTWLAPQHRRHHRQREEQSRRALTKALAARCPGVTPDEAGTAGPAAGTLVSFQGP